MLENILSIKSQTKNAKLLPAVIIIIIVVALLRAWTTIFYLDVI